MPYMGGYAKSHFKKGLEEGVQQGMQQGMQEGAKRVLDQHVRAFLKAGVSPEVIAKAVNLSLDEVKRIQEVPDDAP